MAATHAWGGALTALGTLTTLGGVAIHQKCDSTVVPNGQSPNSCGQPLVNPATVVGLASTGIGVYMLTRPDPAGRGRTRSRASALQGRTASRAARRAGHR